MSRRCLWLCLAPDAEFKNGDEILLNVSVHEPNRPRTKAFIDQGITVLEILAKPIRQGR